MQTEADDMWLYWMGRLNGSVVKKSANNRSQIMWPGSQATALSAENSGYLNGICRKDQVVKFLYNKYGMPT
jgi:hypothetical protein